MLVDFWTYSCINCLRTLPHVKAWARKYGPAGLVVVGVHTPEFAFEHVVSNVRSNAKRLGVRYPVAIDNAYGTWDAWGNQYWPADYLIDRNGHVREAHFGEGDYDGTEQSIRTLLARARRRSRRCHTSPIRRRRVRSRPRRTSASPGSTATPAASSRRASRTCTSCPLGWARTSSPTAERGTSAPSTSSPARQPGCGCSTGPATSTSCWAATAPCDVLVDGAPAGTVEVDGDRLYTAVQRQALGSHLLELRLSPGVQAYSFTFG